MKNSELSEIVFGMMLADRIPASMCKPDWFSTPYDKGVEILLQKGATKEDVAKVISSAYLNDAHDSVKRMNGLGEELDWPKALKESKEKEDLSKKFDKISKKLKNNEDVDLLETYSNLSAILAQASNETQLLKDIDYSHFTPMIESGWDVIDDIVGGIPKHGLIVVMGETGLGKSFFLGRLTDKFLHKHEDKKGMIITLEMPAEEYAQRTVNMYPSFKELGERVYINGSLRTIDDIVLEVTTHKVDFVGIDFVDWLVNDNNESAYAYVYKRCVEMARLLRIPVVLLAQPNREGVKSRDGSRKFLTKFDLRYTGMAENSAWMLIGLQQGDELELESDVYPVFEENREYMLFLKLRGQWKKQVGPGAIVLEKSNQKWGGKAYKGRLWTKGSSDNVIGRKEEKKVTKKKIVEDEDL